MKYLLLLLSIGLIQACDEVGSISYGGALIHHDGSATVCVDVTTVEFYSSAYAVYTVNGAEFVTDSPLAYYPGQLCDYTTPPVTSY